MAEIANERDLLNKTLVRVLTEPPIFHTRPPTLAGLLVLHVGKNDAPVRLDDANIAERHRGGSAEVTEFSTGGGDSAFFKPGKDTLETRQDDEILDDLRQGPLSPDEQIAMFNSLQNERYLAVEDVGIDPLNARMGNRDVATYRLNLLLGEDVIARAKKAVRSDGTTGSLMDKAKGKSAAELMGSDKVGKDAQEAGQKGRGALNQQDPHFMRLLSKLQIVDLLAYQIDRNPKNYFIQQDSTGRVTAITGIDNDLALGTTASQKKTQQLPGFSRFVDRELAERVLALDLSLLPAVFADLLSPAEIAALISRFNMLRASLRDKTTVLLKPAQWTDAVAQGLLDEKRSYWSAIQQYHKADYGPAQ